MSRLAKYLDWLRDPETGNPTIPEILSMIERLIEEADRAGDYDANTYLAPLYDWVKDPVANPLQVDTD